VFIGKPCDATALRKARKMRPELDRNVGLSIGIFCAGTPALKGSIDLLEKLGVDADSVAELRYRGRGWPGNFSVMMRDSQLPPREISYLDAWGFLQRYRPFRCHLCADGTSEFADISCGDPWYRKLQEGEAGSSLVLARTEKGREILQGALKEGYVVLVRRDPQILETSQRNLLAKRSAIWGRLVAMKTFGIPTPRLKGFRLFSNWCDLSFVGKIRSIFGTTRRIIKRKYYRPTKYA
jgi:coenzyme F420 hydrogenase subunit beta